MANLSNINNKFLVTTGGNVGINTTSPDSKLDVTGGDITVNTTGTGFMNFKYSGSQKGTIGTDGIDLKITANADLQLLPASNVGIGTASPSEKLEVSGGHIKITNAGNTNLYINANAANADATIFFEESDSVKAKIQHDASNDSMLFTDGSYTDTMTLKGGNVGIGTTSPQHLLHLKSTISGPTGIIIENTNNAQSLDIDFWNNAGAAQGRIRYNEGAGSFDFFPNVGASSAMTMLYGGNVGIGTADGPGDVNAKLHVYKQAGDNTVTELLRLDCGENNHNVGKGGAIVFRDINVYSDTAKIIAQRVGNSGASTLQFSLRGGEKMRIKSDGNVGIGTTSPTYKLHVASSNNVSIFEDTSNASGAAFIVFNRPGVFSMGSITRNGSANSVSYNTGSDYRLKEDLKDFNALDLVNNITAYDYKWKDIEQRDYGFIAHELKQTLPNVVTGEKDGEKMQGVDYSKLTPILLKAIQELEARVKELENK